MHISQILHFCGCCFCLPFFFSLLQICICVCICTYIYVQIGLHVWPQVYLCIHLFVWKHASIRACKESVLVRININIAVYYLIVSCSLLVCNRCRWYCCVCVCVCVCGLATSPLRNPVQNLNPVLQFCLWNLPTVSVWSFDCLLSIQTTSLCLRHENLPHSSHKNKNFWRTSFFFYRPETMELIAIWCTLLTILTFF